MIKGNLMALKGRIKSRGKSVSIEDMKDAVKAGASSEPKSAKNSLVIR